MPYILLVADPQEKQWSVMMQTDSSDDIINEVDKHDPSLRIVLHTDNFITFDTRSNDEGS